MFDMWPVAEGLTAPPASGRSSPGQCFAGGSAPPPLPPASHLSWERRIALLGIPLFRRQLLMVSWGSGLFMGLLLSFIFAATGEFSAIPLMWLVALLAAVALTLLLFLVTLLLFGSGLAVRFTLDEEGATWQTTDRRALTANRLVILAGVLGGGMQLVGAGTLAISREDEKVDWPSVKVAEFDPGRNIIILRSSWRPLMMIVCLPENYERVAALVSSRIISSDPLAEKRAGKSIILKGFLRTILVTLAAAPLFILAGSYFFDLDLFLPIFVYLFTLATVWLVPVFGWVIIVISPLLALLIFLEALDSFTFLDSAEQLMVLLSFLGLGYLCWFAWGSLRGRIIPLLLQD